MNNSNYTIVSIPMMLDTNLSNTSKVLYTILKGLAEDINFVKISEKELGNKLNCTDRTIRNGMDELVEYGLIAKYRPTIRDIQSYIIIPYEIREVVELQSEDDFNFLLKRVSEYVRVEIEGEYIVENEVGIEIPEPVIEDSIITGIKHKLATGEKLNTYDYGAYLYMLNKERYGIITNFRGARQLQMLKRVTKHHTSEMNLKLLKTFVTIYDDRFKKRGFEFPTVEGFSTAWIHNIVVMYTNNYEMDNRELNLANEVF